MSSGSGRGPFLRFRGRVVEVTKLDRKRWRAGVSGQPMKTGGDYCVLGLFFRQHGVGDYALQHALLPDDLKLQWGYPVPTNLRDHRYGATIAELNDSQLPNAYLEGALVAAFKDAGLEVVWVN